MTPQIFKIKGMHCASCAARIEKIFKKQDGVTSAEVNYGSETAKVVFDSQKVKPEQLSQSIQSLGYSLVLPERKEHAQPPDIHGEHLGLGQAKKEKLEEIAAMRAQVRIAIPLAVLSILLMSGDILAQLQYVAPMTEMTREFFHHLMPLVATYMMFVVGKPYLLGVYRFFRYGAANMDTLIGIGTLAAYLYSFVVTAFDESLKSFINVENTYYDVTIVVIAFIALGKFLEARSKLKTGDAIEKLLNLQAKTALVIRDHSEIEIPVENVVVGDHVIVKPGGKIPVDGVIIEGSSFIDEALVTGEPMPIEKKIGDSVVSGTLNTNSAITIEAKKVGSETLLAQIVTMVEQAQSSKAPIQALADTISSVFVPIVLVVAFATLAVWMIVGTRYLGFSSALSFGLTSFVGVLVIACPCALGLATPTAIIVGVGKGAREGILVKDAATLEKLHSVTTIVVDKTGTITRGKPELVGLKNFSSLSDTRVLAILSALESKSEHPIAHAIIAAAKEQSIDSAPVDQFNIVKGKGLNGIIDGKEYYAGNTALITDLNIAFDRQFVDDGARQGKTPVILASASEVIAIAFVADALKPEAVTAVSELHRLGVNVVMLTGDHKNTAQAIGKIVGIDTIVAEALPEDKLKTIKELQSQGKIVAMAGDGVNDAPALAQADVGIAMATGTDVAIDAAGITLLHGDISKLVKAIRLSKLTMRGIKQNLFWAFAYNVVGIPLAAGMLYPITGWLLNPIFAGLAMAFSSVSVVSNSLRLKVKKL